MEYLARVPDANSTRIDSLRLVNYRRFADLSMDLDRELTVLVAANGGGKTAILDALVSVWAPFLSGLDVSAGAARLSRDDVRRVIGPEHAMEPVLPVRILATGLIDEHLLDWGQSLHSIGLKAKPSSTQSSKAMFVGKLLHRKVVAHAAREEPDSPTLPLLCYYGTGRLWHTRTRASSKKVEQADTSRFSGYTDCLAPTSSFQFFESWFRRFAYEAQSELTSRRPSPHKPQERLEAVRGAVGRLLAPSGWGDLEWDFAEDTLVASHANHGRLAVRLLSDGIRNMIGLVGDIAHRAVRLNPHFGAEAPLKTPGVVLIDEVDMHLHPGWQQTVVASLREAFPAVQLVVTTHSHLVISTIPSRCIRVLGADDSVSTPNVEMEGYDSPFALGVVFGVNSNPPVETARQLTRYRALVEQGEGDTEEAGILRERLLDHFGAAHPAMLEADGLHRIQQLKARIGATRGVG